MPEGRSLLGRFEELERREGGQISRRTNHKPHLLVSWLADLIRDQLRVAVRFKVVEITVVETK